MTRKQLEHILRASIGITGAHEFIVVGSQSILGQFPDAPVELCESQEADVFSRRSPQDADLIDGSIGEESPFHRTFGYYAHGVGRETSVLPMDWEQRLIPVSGPDTGGATGLCLEVHDLAVAKLVAGREKDVSFVRALVRHGMVTVAVLRDRLAQTVMDDARRTLCEARLAGL